MRYSVREAKARLSELIAAAERGEEVVVTRHGEPVIEMVKARPKGGIDWEGLEAARRELGIDQREHEPWPREFDDPAFSWRVLGFEDEARAIEEERGYAVGDDPDDGEEATSPEETDAA